MTLGKLVLTALRRLAGPEAATIPLGELFVGYEAQNNAYELAIAYLGLARAARPDVRAYAAALVADHAPYAGALRDLAAAKGIQVPPGLVATDRDRLGVLAGKGGAAFDREFLREAERINGEAIRYLRNQGARMAGPEVCALVDRCLAADERHEAAARALRRQRGVGGTLPRLRDRP